MQSPPISAKPVAFIGLGSMGLAMARHLLEAGFAVRGYDVQAAATEAFAALGGMPAGGPGAAAADCDLVLLMVVNAAQARAVLFDPAGVAATATPGAAVVLCSTVSPSDARALAEDARAHGLRLVDAPVSGGRAGAERGDLTVMVSGPRAVYDEVEQVLGSFGENLYWLGEEIGIAATVKAVNQLLAGVHLATAAEAMALGARAGADPRLLFEIISKSAGRSWMFEDRVPHMLDNDYSPKSAVEIFVKDLSLVLDVGRDLRFPLPMAATAAQLFTMAAAAGHGAEDDAAVVKIYEQLAGISVAMPRGLS